MPLKRLSFVLFAAVALAWVGWCACQAYNRRLPAHAPTSDGGIPLDDPSWIAPSIIIPITSGP